MQAVQMAATSLLLDFQNSVLFPAAAAAASSCSPKKKRRNEEEEEEEGEEREDKEKLADSKQLHQDEEFASLISRYFHHQNDSRKRRIVAAVAVAAAEWDDSLEAKGEGEEEEEAEVGEIMGMRPAGTTSCLLIMAPPEFYSEINGCAFNITKLINIIKKYSHLAVDQINPLFITPPASDSDIQASLESSSLSSCSLSSFSSSPLPASSSVLEILLLTLFTPRILALHSGPPSRLFSTMLDQVAVLHPRAVFHGILVPLLSKLAFDSSSSSSSPPRLASVVVANNNISVGINVHQVSVLSRICQNALSTHDRLHLYLINLSSAISPSPPLQLSTMKKWNEVMIPFVQALLLGSSSSNNSHLSLSDCCEWTEDCFLAAMKLLESCFPQTTIKTSKKFSALLLAFLNQCVKMKNTFKISIPESFTSRFKRLVSLVETFLANTLQSTAIKL